MSNYYRATSPAFTSRQSDRWRRNQNTVAFAPAVKLGPISHTIIVALMVTVLGLIYLTQVTRSGSYSYDINTLDTRLSALKAQKEDLQNENARLQALNTVSSSSVAKAMTTPVATEQASN